MNYDEKPIFLVAKNLKVFIADPITFRAIEKMGEVKARRENPYSVSCSASHTFNVEHIFCINF